MAYSHPDAEAIQFRTVHPDFMFPDIFRSRPQPGVNLNSEIMSVRNKNIENSLFYRLPTEILIMIEACADGLSIMTLRGACVRFKEIFRDPTADVHNILNVERWRKEYKARRKAFCKQELCQREKVGEFVESEELVCTSCICTHPSSFFDTHMQNKEPEKRECIGWSRELRICTHKSTTLRMLRGGVRPGTSCPEHHAGETTPYILTGSSQRYTLRNMVHAFSEEWPNQCYFADRMYAGIRGVRLGVVGHGVDEEGRVAPWKEGCSGFDLFMNGVEKDQSAVVVRTEIVVLRSEAEAGAGKIGSKEVREKMRMIMREERGGLGMCPHLTHAIVTLLLLRDPYVECPMTERHSNVTYPCPPPVTPNFTASLYRHPTPAPHSCGRRYHCLDPDCGTYFYFYRAEYVDLEKRPRYELVLCVVRNLGDRWNALDKRWLVQLTEPKSTGHSSSKSEDGDESAEVVVRKVDKGKGKVL
ncbi:hypothetical protein BDV95DRAFT_561814 [Massariosphaeria phaeospora]|uniref:F-box domain-containing protein n=1 Tax=Massariosphaeria phaeospora TaxID=100035 RepID=A0A7C8IFA1_9PLEO|nr:hypothetical protein BDV95DRAFT_561814 [Massariosphaeria phaeospora]